MHKALCPLLLCIFFAAFIGEGSCVNWSNITSSQLQGLPTSVFASITESQLSSIPPAAFDGLLPDQLQAIPYNSIAGLNASQLREFRNTTCAGFVVGQVRKLDPRTAEGLRIDCLLYFRASACNGLQSAFVSNLDPDTFAGFTPECVAYTTSTAFQYVNQTQIKKIPPAAFAGFIDQLQYLQFQTFTEISLDQLLELSPVYSTLGGMTPKQLLFSTIKYGEPLLNQWTPDQTQSYPKDDVVACKQLAEANGTFSNWAYMSSHKANVTWLQMLFLANNASQLFPETLFQQLPPSAIMGIRYNQVIQHITPQTFSYLSADQAKYFLNDTTSALNTQALQEIPANVFGSISIRGIEGLTAMVIPSITLNQTKYMTTTQLNAMNCDQIFAITSAQTDAFQTAVRGVYQQQLSICTNPPLVPSPPVQAPVKPPINTPANNVTMTPSNQSEGSLSKYHIIVIAIACGGAAVVVAAIVAIVVWKKRSKDPERRGLLTNQTNAHYA